MTTSVLDWVRSFNTISPNGPLAGDFTTVNFSNPSKKSTIDNYLEENSNNTDLQLKDFSFEEVENVAKYWRKRNLK